MTSSTPDSGASDSDRRQAITRRQPGDGCDVSGCADNPEDETVDVLSLAGRQPPSEGAWLLVTEADGNPGCQFTARILNDAMPSADGGDVVIRLAPDDPAPGQPPPAAWIGAYAIMSGRLVAAGSWPGCDLNRWPERIRLTVAFAMAMLTELKDHGTDLGPPVNLIPASRTTARTPLPIAFPESRASPPARA